MATSKPIPGSRWLRRGAHPLLIRARVRRCAYRQPLESMAPAAVNAAALFGTRASDGDFAQLV
jgi:hypothetical protein